METLLPLLGFAIAASVTPGPNTLMVAAMAARGGAWAPLPAMFGILLGFAVLLLVAALGLAAPLAASPAAQAVLRWVGAGWLLWLAFRVAMAPPPETGPSARVMGFWGAAAFQWVNPKAWLVGLAAIAAFSAPGEGVLGSGIRIAAVFGLVSMPALGVWAALGAGAGRALRTARAWRIFNLVMGLLLAASILPLLR